MRRWKIDVLRIFFFFFAGTYGGNVNQEPIAHLSCVATGTHFYSLSDLHVKTV